MLPDTLPTSKANQLSDLQRAILNVANRPFEHAIALPPGAYTDPDFYHWEVEYIFKKQWLCIGHVSQVPKPGDYINFTLLQEPMTVVHGKEGNIHTLSRVCPHRAMDIMPEAYGHPPKGNRRSFICPYHHWTYGLNGQLIGAPEMHQHQDFDPQKLCLHRLRTEVWQGFIFITFDPNLESVSDHYAGLLPYLERWKMAEMEMVVDLKWDCHFNWKILVENFMEPYHHMGAHYRTFEPLMPATGTWTEPETLNYVVCHLPFTKHLVEQIRAGQSSDVFTPPPTLEADDHYEYAVYLGEPNFLLFVGPDRVYWYFLLPEGPDKMILRTTLLVTPDSKELDNYDQALEQETEALKRFHLEDMEVCTAVQQGANSSFYTPGPLSHLEMPIWLFQRYLARQIGAAIQSV